MKKKFAVLFTILIAAAFLFCGLVPQAQAAPVLTWKVEKFSHAVNKDHPGLKDKNHLRLHVSILYRNVSSDQIVTAIFDKTLKVEGSVKFASKFENDVTHTRYTFGYSIKIDDFRSTRVNKVELYPGQTIVLHYDLPLSSVIKTDGSRHEASLENFNKGHYKKMKYKVTGHTYRISKKPI